MLSFLTTISDILLIMMGHHLYIVSDFVSYSVSDALANVVEDFLLEDLIQSIGFTLT